MIYERQITITVGENRKSVNWKPQTLLLSEFYTRLSIPARSSETMAVYLGLTKGQQDDLKDIGGFVAGTLSGTRRKANAVTGRDVLTLDLDNIPAGGTDDVCRRVEALGCGYCIYSTRKHMPSAPRLRVLLPLDRTATADEYEPCARRMAEKIGMELTDPTTFEASRMMYFPSVCTDGQYVYYAGDKPLLSVGGLLGTYAAWRDYTSWPTIPGAITPARLAAKPGDPLTKKGIVGAFCRSYDIRSAMDTFLPGVYAPVDTAPDRFTFCEGSTTGGAVLYDGGKFLYSHHATDPCGGKLVNSFDLVRLHCFGDLDDDAAPGTPVIRLPSYTAMCEKATADETVACMLADERWARAKDAFQHVMGFSNAGIPALELRDHGAWRRPPMMALDLKGNPIKSMGNLRNTLEHDPRLKGKLRLNLFSGKIDVTGALPWARPAESAVWGDDDVAQLRIYLEPFFGKLARNDVLDVVAVCASNQAYHPVREYLNGLIWDGVHRLDTLFIDYLGAQDWEYTRVVTRKSFVAAVARVMCPGCKHDTMLVLVGGQGKFKSTILRLMGGEWYSDSLRTFGDKDSMETIQGTWLNEVPEMQAMKRTDIEGVKAFLTKTSDYYRAAYGRYTADRPRQCVLFGTTNSKDCLVDQTGNRRWWPVDIDRQKRKKHVFRDLQGERDQLWAEAVVRWKAGETTYLSPEMEEIARHVQEDHRSRHPWEGIISEFLEKKVPADWVTWDLNRRMVFWNGGAKYDGDLVERDRVCAVEVWCEALGRKSSDMTKGITREVNGILGLFSEWEASGVRLAGKPYGKQRLHIRK